MTAFFRHYEEFTLSELIEEITQRTDFTEADLPMPRGSIVWKCSGSSKTAYCD